MKAWQSPRCRIFLLEGEKFRRNLFVLFFDIPLKRETATKTALLAEVLKRQSWKEMTRQAEELYGALWDVSVVKKGDRQLLLFSLETIKNVETENALAFLQKLIFSGKEGFAENTIERQKDILQKKLKSVQDDKRAFARKRILEETAEGTDHAVSGDGYVEDLEEIGAKGLFRFYQQLLQKAEVKIFFCGDKVEKPKVVELRKVFPGMVSGQERAEKEQPKNGPRFVEEKAEMEQARLLLGFSAAAESSRRQVALLLLNQILGGSGDSLLFQSVREEQGLCYDIKSYLEPMMPYLFLQAGVRQKDARKAGKEMLKCIEQIKKEGVSAEKLQQAKASLLRQLDGLSDSPWGMVDFFAEQALQEKALTTERMQRQIWQMEGEDIRRAAEHLELRVVYLLGGKEKMKDAE